MSQTEYEAAVAEFIRRKGITRCPTVCLAPTQGSAAATDRLAQRAFGGLTPVRPTAPPQACRLTQIKAETPRRMMMIDGGAKYEAL